MDQVSEPVDTYSTTESSEVDDSDEFVPCLPGPSTLDSGTSTLPLINPSLSWDERAALEDLLSTYPDVFSEIPSCTDTLQHDIQLTTSSLIKAKNYPVPINLRL